MISQKSIQEVYEAIKIEEVVGDFVNLRPRGVNMLGLCPFHSEKTPSFTVSPTKSIYKCFGCGNAGNAVHFVMEHEQMSYPDAIRYLAKKYQIKLEEDQVSEEYTEERQRIESLYLVNQFALEYYVDQLWNTDEGKSVGLSYFKERGYREETIRKFGLGYAPRSGKVVELAKAAGYKEEFLVELGLQSKSGRDFFFERVMFPIRNLTGKVIGFGGRILRTNKKAPKYLNSPESEIYNKSKSLYGVHFARKAIRKQDECLMVEGYTDVLSLQQAGIENVVASSGTSLTVDQIRLLKRQTPNMRIVYDGDAAGVKAAIRGLDLVLEQDMNVKVVQLPEGEDPDSHLKNLGSDAFTAYLEEQGHDFLLFKTNLMIEEAAGDPIKKTALLKDLVESISRIPDPLKRNIYIQTCAKRLEMSEQILVQETNKRVRARLQKESDKKGQTVEVQESGEPIKVDKQEDRSAKAKSVLELHERDVVRILVEFGHRPFNDEMKIADYILQFMESVLHEFETPLYADFVKRYLGHAKENFYPDAAFFVHHENEGIAKLAIELTSSPYTYSKNWEDRWDNPMTTQKMPEDNFVEDALHSVQLFKYRKINQLCKKSLERIQVKTIYDGT